MRIGVKIAPGVNVSTRVGGKRRKTRKSGNRGWFLSFIGGLIAVGFALEHAWLIFGVIIPLIAFVFCMVMAVKMQRRKHQ